jgi:hypothetical protein
MILQRRGLLAIGLAPLVWPQAARAGAQVEEPLADAVRSALAKAVGNAAPPKPAFDSTEQRIAFLRWLLQALARPVATRCPRRPARARARPCRPPSRRCSAGR